MFALDGDAVHQTMLALVVVKRIVPGCPIVPECNRAFLPLKSSLKLWSRRVLIEKVQERLTLFLGPALEVSREPGIDI